MLKINDLIFVVPGFGSEKAIHKISMKGDDIKSTVVIAEDKEMKYNPVLLEVPAGFCAAQKAE